MKISKKILLSFGILASTIFGLFMNTNEVKAENYTGQAIWPSEYISNIYIKKDRSDGYSKYQQARFIRRSEDNKFVYCLQPFVDIDNNYVYKVARSDYETYLNMTKEQFVKANLYAYYGYGYTGHSEHKWYAITQLLIWRTVEPNSQIYFTNSLNGTRNDSLFASEIAELENLVNSHYKTPQFNELNNLSMPINQTITINDVNGKLNEYSVKETKNINASINGNSLTITATGIGEASLTISKSDTKFTVPPIVYFNDHSQNVFRLGAYDPITVNFRLSVFGGKVTINKIDKETNQQKAQGDATLQGARYGIYQENGNKVGTITTVNNGNATSGYLPSLGKYYLLEEASSTGYYVDNTKYYFDVTLDNLNPSVNVYEEIIKSKIKITKLDNENNSCLAQGDATLQGAKYGIYNSKNELVDTVVIGNDCTATSKDLPYGKYTIKELESSEGYYIDSNSYEIHITNNNIVNVTSKEQVIKTKIKVTKLDSENKTCTAQGQAKLDGAKYGIYNSKNELVDTVVIGNDCTATSKDLPYGKYTVKELEPSEGYYIDSTKYSISIVNNELIEIISYEEVIKNYISILKQYDFVDGQTTFLNAEKDIVFDIYYLDGRKFDSIKTDKNGYASINLPYGVWKLRQVNTNTGYEKIYDFFITVNRESELEQYYNILNNKLSAYLQVFKVDEETGKTIALANTTFKIYNKDTKQYISQFVGGKVYSEFKTDDEGKFVTYLKLEAGNYKLIEVSSPKGYLLNKDGLDFTIGNDTHYSYTTYGAFITVYFKDKPIKGIIEVNKTGENVVIENGEYSYGTIKLDGVEFELYASEDIKSSDGNHIYYLKGDLVDKLVTDKNGYAKSKELPLGKYYLIEVKTKDGYVLNDTKYNIELVEKDNKTAIVYSKSDIDNKLFKGKLEFTKTDLVTGDVIPNTKVEIYTDKDELIFTGKTNNEGKIIIKDLFVGKFYIVETEAVTGYKLNNDKVYFEIKSNGEIVKANMTNEKIKGTLEFTKVDFSTSEPLPNTLIEIFNEKDELVFSGRTDENGKIIIEELEYGKYYIVESEAPEGYQINNEKMYFEILEDGEIVKCTMTDEKIIIEVPNTEENSYIIPISVLLIGISTGIIIYEEIKKKRKK